MGTEELYKLQTALAGKKITLASFRNPLEASLVMHINDDFESLIHAKVLQNVSMLDIARRDAEEKRIPEGY